MSLVARVRRSLVPLVVAAAAVVVPTPAPAVAGTVLTVNSVDDDAGGCGFAQTCTLRGALLQLDSGGPGVIRFEIASGHQTIRPASPLPPVPPAVVLDATTQPGYAGSPLIEIDGTLVAAGVPAAAGLTLEGDAVVRGLVVNRFGGPGIVLQNGSNAVELSYVGTDVTGTLDRGNSGAGIAIIDGSSENRIGGSGAGNVISGNGRDGIEIGGGGSSLNLVLGNLIGTRATGRGDLGNGWNGIGIYGATGTWIGGPGTAERNVVSGNGINGIDIRNGGTGTMIQGNHIGTNLAGGAAIPNDQHGILLLTGGNRVGGPTPAHRNVVSGNTHVGIATGSTSSGNDIGGNHIGTNAAGTVDLGNGGAGVSIGGSDHDVGRIMGEFDPGPANVISGNGAGIVVFGAGNRIGGNVIGMSASVTKALGNDLAGVAISGGSDNRVGGPSFYDENWIAGNPIGIQVEQAATRNVITNNHIGVEPTPGVRVGNGSAGIVIGYGATRNTVGPRNFIQANGTGIRLAPFVQNEPPATRNRITRNYIVKNGGLGIDLWPNGVSVNDAGDADTGYNQLQNFPIVRSAKFGNNNLIDVLGSLSSKPNTKYRIEIFFDTDCDPSGYGEGNYQTYRTVTTDSNGNAQFAASFGEFQEIFPGYVVTATATDPNGNTSEFSPCSVIAPHSYSLVHVSDHLFSPSVLPLVSPAAVPAVQWNFTGPSTHTVTDASGMELFDSGARGAGSAFQQHYFAAGTYPYVCSIHPSQMTGSVEAAVVAEPDSGPLGTTFEITWASRQAAAGFVYDVEIRRPGGEFIPWRSGVTAEKASFTPSRIGTFAFRARMRGVNGGEAQWSPPTLIDVS